MEKQQRKLTDFRFHYTLNTRWRDMDAFGHVNNAAFLTYFEDARIQIVQSWSLVGGKESLIVAALHIDFYQQLMHPAALTIGTTISRLGNTSFDFSSCLYQENNPHPSASAVVTAVCFDYVNEKPVKVFPKIIRSADLLE